MSHVGLGDQVFDPGLIEQAFSAHLEDKAKPRRFDQLDLNGYIEMFLHRDRWSTFSSFVGLDPGPIRKLLGDLRSARNDLAHFRWPITSQKREQLRFACDWLGRLRQDTGRHLGEGRANGRHAAPAPVVPPSVTPPERVEADTSRYAALASYLQEQSDNVNTLELTFEMVEQAMGARLPPSARHRSW